MSDQNQDRDPVSRRRLLRTTGGALAATGLLGAASAAVQDREQDQDQEQEEGAAADAGRYADVYEETIDDVVLVNIGSPGDGGGPQGLGSGFVIENDYVVTNNHVVGDASEVELQFRDEQWRTASVVGTDVHSDIAVLELEDVPEMVDGLAFADDEPTIGQEVLALGNPLGFDASITQGIVSGVDRSLPSPTGFSIPAAIQTDAPVNPGNSGGPLVSLEGDVLGIVFAGAGQTIGFAISAQLAERVVPELIEDGEYDHPYMGVGVLPVGPAVAEANDLEEPQGVLITNVAPNGPADGVLAPADRTATVDGAVVRTGGDVIVAIDDEEIPNQERLSAYLALETSPGDVIDLEVVRDGERQTVELELGERPAVDTP